jgi:hypothetical protein
MALKPTRRSGAVFVLMVKTGSEISQDSFDPRQPDGLHRLLQTNADSKILRIIFTIEAGNPIHVRVDNHAPVCQSA